MNSTKFIDITKPGEYGFELEEAVRLCETAKDFSVRIVVPDKCDIKSVLDDLYDFVKDSVKTVSEFVSAKQNRISFVTGSYIDVESLNSKGVDADG